VITRLSRVYLRETSEDEEVVYSRTRIANRMDFQELVVSVELPKCPSASPVELDITERGLTLDCQDPGPYHLELKLPWVSPLSLSSFAAREYESGIPNGTPTAADTGCFWGVVWSF
jgi:hypothetical protein